MAQLRDDVGFITLETRWWWSLADAGLKKGQGELSTPVDVGFSVHDYISWRIFRVREEEDSFLVKEGVAEGRELLAADSDRYGYR